MKTLTLVIFSLVLLATVAAGVTLVFLFHDDDQKDDAPPLDGFSAGQGTHLGLSAETETKIKHDYLVFDISTEPGTTAEDVVLHKYYGAYGGSIAATIGYSFYMYSNVITNENIDGVKVTYPNANTILVWNNGSFYRLQEAYDGGLLTKDDIKRIAEVCPLFWSEEKQIRQGYVDAFIEQSIPEATADGIWVEFNYGRYDNGLHGETIVLMIWHKEEGTTGAIRGVSVGGVKFTYGSGYSITAWNDGSFYGLQDAYDRGLLTVDEIKNISEIHRAAYPFLYQK